MNTPMAGVLMAAGDGHPADVNDLAVWFHAESRTASSVGSGPGGSTSRPVAIAVPSSQAMMCTARSSYSVPFAAIGDVRSRRPALFDHGRDTGDDMRVADSCVGAATVKRYPDARRRCSWRGRRVRPAPGAHAGIVGGD